VFSRNEGSLIFHVEGCFLGQIDGHVPGLVHKCEHYYYSKTLRYCSRMIYFLLSYASALKYEFFVNTC